jgi:hypothetical protein
MQHPHHLKVIKKTRKSPVLKPSAFRCLGDTPSINLSRGAPSQPGGQLNLFAGNGPNETG